MIQLKLETFTGQMTIDGGGREVYQVVGYNRLTDSLRAGIMK